MKSNELRIGNWYDENGTQRQVTPNIIEEIWVSERKWVEPITLTEEWLVRFGFEETSRYGKYLEFNINTDREQSFRLPICKHSDKDYWYILRGSAKVKYIHQLQNLYFALTGEELRLK